MVLEFVKILAAPAAAVVAVVASAHLALHTFKRQKALERRLAWYEAMMNQLIECTNAYSLVVAAPEDSDLFRRARQAFKTGKDLAFHAYLYADAINVVGLDLWRSELENCTWDKTVADAVRLRRACLNTAGNLSNDVRRDLGLPMIHPREIFDLWVQEDEKWRQRLRPEHYAGEMLMFDRDLAVDRDVQKNADDQENKVGNSP